MSWRRRDTDDVRAGTDSVRGTGAGDAAARGPQNRTGDAAARGPQNRAGAPAGARRWSRTAWARGLTAAAAAALLFAGGSAALRPSPVAHAQGVNLPGHTITVMGTDRQSVAPDQAEVTLGVTTLADTAAASQSQNSTTSGAVIAAVESAGVAADDIQTTGYNLSPRYHQGKPGQPEQISGFETTHMLTITVRDIKQVGAVVDAGVASGANQVQGVGYTVSNQSKIQLASYAAAVKDARARADAIAAALGVQVSGAYAVDATNSSWTGPIPFSAVAAPSAAMSAPIEPGRQTVQTQVKVVFSFS